MSSVDENNNDLCKDQPQSQFIVGFGVYLIHTKTAKLYKKGVAFKGLGEKSCEIKGGGHEMAAMVLMIMHFNST